VSEAEWDGFVHSHPAGTVEQLWGWQSIFRDVFRQDPVYLAARRRQAIVGVLPLVRHRSLLFGRSVVSLPYANYAGLVTSDADAARALAAEARRIATVFGASHVELRNVARHLPHEPCRTHKVGARLSLPASAEALWSSLDRKVRNQVRKAQKEGLSVEHGGEELVEAFYPVFARNMRDLGTPVFPKALFGSVFHRFGALGRVIVVRSGATPVAAAVSLTWRGTALVPWASSLRSHRHLSPNMLLYWSMLERAAASGCHTFDFGRSTRDGSTHQFKRQWGTSDVPLHWEYALLTRERAADQGSSSPRFALAVDLWRRLPLPLANRLGPAIIRHIP
jgi:FemAB-related protein (PEP-CTERM system-associated)